MSNWKKVKGYGDLYEVSNKGLVYVKPRQGTKGGYTYGNPDKDGYLTIGLSMNSKETCRGVHCLVYEAFVGDIPQGYDVHHKDHNKQNNSIENLELIERSIHKSIHIKEHLEKTVKAHIENVSKKVQQLTKDGEFVAEYDSIMEASRKTNINYLSISRCCNKKPHYNTAGGFIWKFAA